VVRFARPVGRARPSVREIADWLEGEHHLSGWWAQKLIVEYEQARGLRPAGARPGGTFTVGTSTTVRVPVEHLYDAVADPAQRDRWLPGAVMRERTSRPHRSARFDWADDGTRISVTFEAKGDAKSQLRSSMSDLAFEELRIGSCYAVSWGARLRGRRGCSRLRPEHSATSSFVRGPPDVNFTTSLTAADVNSGLSSGGASDGVLPFSRHSIAVCVGLSSGFPWAHDATRPNGVPASEGGTSMAAMPYDSPRWPT